MKTFQEIYEASINKARISSVQTTYVDMIKDAINKRYEELLNMKKWSFLRTTRDLIVPAKYTTGTVNVTYGERTVIFSAALDSSYKNRFFSVDGQDEVYQILTINGTNAVISAPYIGSSNATATFAIWRSEFGLWPDCEELNSVWHDKFRRPMKLCGPREVLENTIRHPKLEGYAVKCAKGSKTIFEGTKLGAFLLGHDFLAGSKPTSEMLSIFPAIAQYEYIIHVNYTKKASKLSLDSDISVIPSQYNHILVDGSLAEFFGDIGSDAKAGMYESRYQNTLAMLLRKYEATSDFQ